MPVDREAAARAIDAFLRALGRDPSSEPMLVGTGARVAEAFADDLCGGYDVDVDALLAKNAIDCASAAQLGLKAAGGATALVVLRDVAVTTTCPHHLMTASGVATVAFAPNRRLLGLGAIADLVDAYAHRLTLQESIGEQVVQALMRALAPRWAGCRLALSHACVTARGERRHGAIAETVALGGELDESGRAAALSALGVGS